MNLSSNPRTAHARLQAAREIASRWFIAHPPACTLCHAMVEEFMATSFALHDLADEPAVVAEPRRLVLRMVFEQGPVFRQIFPTITGVYYQWADGNCPQCARPWRYEFDAHDGLTGELTLSHA